MISAADYQDIVCYLDKYLISKEKSYTEIQELISFINSTNISVERKLAISNPLQKAYQDILNFRSRTTEINLLISRMNQHVISNFVSLDDFISQNNIKIPANVNTLFASNGFNISSANIGSCENFEGIISLNSSVKVNSVVKISSTQYSWYFGNDFEEDELIIDDILDLKVDRLSPKSIVTIKSPILILEYQSTEGSSWSAESSVNIIFNNDLPLEESSGTIS